MYASLVSWAKIKCSRSWPSRPAAVTSPILWWGHNNIMVRSQHLKDTTTQHITTHMHGYEKKYITWSRHACVLEYIVIAADRYHTYHSSLRKGMMSLHLKDTTTQHITTHMHGYKKKYITWSRHACVLEYIVIAADRYHTYHSSLWKGMM